MIDEPYRALSWSPNYAVLAHPPAMAEILTSMHGQMLQRHPELGGLPVEIRLNPAALAVVGRRLPELARLLPESMTIVESDTYFEDDVQLWCDLRIELPEGIQVMPA